MSAIHYKFSSSNEYKNITFDGVSVSLTDLKKAIMEKQKLKSTELDLHITNAQTLQVYRDESALIPKNTAVLVRRIPLGPIRDSKVYIVKRNDTTPQPVATTKISQDPGPQPKLTFDELTKASNLAEANASEDDKIKAAIKQSTNEYDPSNFVRPPKYGSYKYSAPTTSASNFVRCYRCNMNGHYSMNCPHAKNDPDKLKPMRLATGIPRSHMVEVNKDSKGAMLTSDGRYVVPVMDKKGYEIGKKEKPPFLPSVEKPAEEEEEEEPIPDELICLLCKDLLVDAVVIPCCGNSYCDECIRNALLDSDTHQCPTCHKDNISPDSLIANKFLRQAVNKFKNDTGIAKKRSNAPMWPRPAPSERPKPVPQPSKIVYGPPHAKITEKVASSGGAYVVKARSDQIVASGYSVNKTSQESGSSSPRDPSQPIRIKLNRVESPMGSSSPSAKAEPTPAPVQPQAESTPVDTLSVPSTTPQSDGYTFNSTPDTAEEKPKPAATEPLPPGISPPMAKVVRPLIDGAVKSEANPATSLSGIHPLSTTPPSDALAPPPATEDPVTTDSSQPLVTEDPPSIVTEPQPSASPLQPVPVEEPSSEPVQVEPVVQTHPLPTHANQTPETSAKQSYDSPSYHSNPQPPPAEYAPVMTTSRPSALFPTPPDEERLPVPVETTPHIPPASSHAIPNAITVPPPTLPTLPVSLPPITIPPPSLALPTATSLPPGLPPGFPKLPPPNVSAAGLFQRPPPPLPFNPFVPPPGTTHPPPGFPPVGPPPKSLSVPPHLAALPPPNLPLPPGTESSIPASSQPLPGSSSNSASERGDVKRLRASRNKRSSTRSPKRRTEHSHRSKKSKLDIMSAEFAEKLSKNRDSSRRTRRRSRSESYSTDSSFSDSRSSASYYSSRSSSSYSSFSGSSWSSSQATQSRSRSPSPRHKHKTKVKGRHHRRRRSQSWSDRSRSRSRARRRRSASASKRRGGERRKSDRPPSKMRRRNRSRTPSPRRKRSPARKDRHEPRPADPHLRSNRREDQSSFPSIPVISSVPVIPGLPSKEQADYERDQALYAHYRQAYERDWYERGIMPPPPYDRFIQPRFSRSPSPPGTGSTVLPPPVEVPAYSVQHPSALVSVPWEQQRPPVPPGPPSAAELYQLQSRMLKEQHYDPVQERLRAIAGNFAGNAAVPYSDAPYRGPDPTRVRRDDRAKRSPRWPRRYDDERRGRNEHRDGRDRYSEQRFADERRGGRGERGGTKAAEHAGSRGSRRDRTPKPPLDDGDATPVRDERPLPLEEAAMKKSNDKSAGAPRRAGDIVKVSTSGRRPKENKSDLGAKGTDQRNRSRDEFDKAARHASRKSGDAKARTGHSKERSRVNRATVSSVATGRSSKSDKRSEKFSRTAASASASEQERKNDNAKEKRGRSKTSARPAAKATDHDETSEKTKSAQTGKPGEKSSGQIREEVAADGKEKSDVEKKAEKNDEQLSKVEQSKVSASEEAEPKSEVIEKSDVAEAAAPAVERQPSPVSAAEAGKDEPPGADHDCRDQTEVSESSEAVAVSAAEPEALAQDTKPVGAPVTESEVRNEREPATSRRRGEVKTAARSTASKAAKRLTSEKKHKRPDSSKRRKEADTDASQRKKPAAKLVEYDGSAPPPTGDELIKITIPKSRWEESDDEVKAAAQVGLTKTEKEVKAATKGRRIRIKRKVLGETASQATDAGEATTRKKPVQDDPTAVDKVSSKEQRPARVAEDQAPRKAPSDDTATSENRDAPASGKVVDARVVITFRRNSKLEQEAKARKVSITDGEDIKPEKSHRQEGTTMDKSVVSVKGKPVKVAGMRSSRQESSEFVHDDVLDLSHPSDLSGMESVGEMIDQKKAMKKRKRKKEKKEKKHKEKRRHHHRSKPEPEASLDSEPEVDRESIPESLPQRRVVSKSRRDYVSNDGDDVTASDEYDDEPRHSGSRKTAADVGGSRHKSKRRHGHVTDESRAHKRRRPKRSPYYDDFDDGEESQERVRSSGKRRRDVVESRIDRDDTARRRRHKKDKKRRHKHRQQRDASGASSFEDDVYYKKSRRQV